MGGGASATLQTTDDGGTTWYDVARSSIVSNANGTTAEWLAGGTVVDANAIGSAAASSLGGAAVSGLPILSQRGRVFLRYGAAITSIISETVEVMANSQSGRA